MLARVCALLNPRLRAFVALVCFGVVPLVALSLGSVWGCAAVLGFDETTLRTEGGTEPVEGGPVTEGGPNPDGGPTPDGGASRLTTTPASIVIRRGATADVTVDLARGSDVTGAVTIRVSNLPAGVTASSPTLAAGVTTATIKLNATATATLGAATVAVNADGTSLAPAQVPLLVADPSGALDVSFDTDGVSSEASRGTGSTFFSLGLQADNAIVAVGAAGPTPTALNGWIVRRFSVSGAVDAAFTTKSSVTGVVPSDGVARAVAIDPSGKIVVVGFSQPAASQQLTVLRLLPTGALDTTFGGGIVRVAAEVPLSASLGYGVAIQPDGAIVVVGSRRDIVSGNESGIILRFLPTGMRDPAFNNGTTVVVAGARFVGVALDAANILAAGSTIGTPLPSYVVTRRTATGAVEPTFGTGGTAAFGNTYGANAFARLPDGSLAFVGDVQQGAAGYTGGVTTAKGIAVFARAYANASGAGFFGIGVQPDGRIIAAGHTAVANGEARVERILADGNKDPTFGAAGTATLEPAGVPNGVDVTLFAAAVQKDGRILAAGNRSNAGASIHRLWP